MRSHLVILGALATIAPLLAAGICAPASPEDGEQVCVDAPADTSQAVQIGYNSVDDSFRALSGTPDIPLEFGNQGGQHLTLDFLVQTPNSGNDWVLHVDGHTATRTATSADGPAANRDQVVRNCDSGWVLVPKLRVIVDYSALPLESPGTMSEPVERTIEAYRTDLNRTETTERVRTPLKVTR